MQNEKQWFLTIKRLFFHKSNYWNVICEQTKKNENEKNYSTAITNANY